MLLLRGLRGGQMEQDGSLSEPRKKLQAEQPPV